MVRREVDIEEENTPCVAVASSQGSPFQAAQGQCSEIITRSYNPDKKFWQTPPKLPDEKIAKTPREEIKITIGSLKAQAVAQLQKDKVTMTIKGLPATPQNQALQARGLRVSCFSMHFKNENNNFAVWSVCILDVGVYLHAFLRAWRPHQLHQQWVRQKKNRRQASHSLSNEIVLILWL